MIDDATANATDVDSMIRRAIGGDDVAISWFTAVADTSSVPSVVAMAALLVMRPARIDRALALARTTRDRQIAVIAGAHLRGEHELVDALARDHLSDHPDSVLVAWIASGAVGRAARTRIREGEHRRAR